jgi:hypothetical protein
MFQHSLSMQHHPEGAATTPAEKSVGTAQGLHNMNLHSVPSSPVISNDPFMDTAPNNCHSTSGFHPSGLGLYGEGLGRGMVGGMGCMTLVDLNRMDQN